MRKIALTIAFLLLLSICMLSYSALLTFKIDNPKPEHCHIQTEKIIKISEGTSYDIIFSDSHGDHYYINRGLQRGLNLESLQANVLNKTVTLHLPKVFGGIVTSEHIAQITLGNEIIFSEFN